VRHTLLAFALCLVSASALRAQVPEKPTTPRFRMGAFYMDPALLLRDVGIDTNVFNEARNPKRDFTATIAPTLNLGVQVRALRLAVFTLTEYVYFHKYREERSTNRRNTIALELDFQRATMFVGAEDAETRARPNPEIDRRARRSEPTYFTGGDVKLGARTTIVLGVKTTEVTVARGETFRDVDLAAELNRRQDTAAATLRFELTPVTTFTLMNELQRNRFDQARYRDADTLRVVGGFDFVPDGRITGRANAGYRDFTARGVAMPDFRGVVSQGDVAVEVIEGTRIGFQVERDVQYSFEPMHPYFVSTSAGAALTQRLFGSIDLLAKVTRTRMDYEDFVGALDAGRRDRLEVAGGTITYRVRESGRIGLNVELMRRTSSLPDRNFETVRVFGSFTYGIRK